MAFGFLPLLGAYLVFFFFPGLIPSGTTNEGTLISPPVGMTVLGDAVTSQIPAGKWTLLIFADEPCGADCQQAIYLARQVNTALGKDADRVQRALLLPSGQLPAGVDVAGYPDMVIHYQAPTLSRTGLPGNATIYLADPVGNIILYYTPGQDGKAMLKDLKHLLKLSNIG